MVSKADSVRINLLRTVLIFGIVVVHIPPAMVEAPPHSDVFGMVKYSFSRALFRAAVPVLTVISGYLLFLRPERLAYRSVAIQKSQRLLWPFLLWNIPFVALLYVIQSRGMLAHDFRFQLYPADLSVLLDAAFAWREGPLNYPLNFLRDLFVLMLAYPLFLWLARIAGWWALPAVWLFFVLNLDGPIINRALMPACFYLGALLAMRKVDLQRLDRFWPVAIVLLIAASVAVAWFDIRNLTYFKTLAVPLIWIAAAPLAATRPGEWLAGLAGYSFFVFLTHGFAVLALWLVWSHVAPPGAYAIFWVLAPFVVFAGAAMGFALLRTLFPLFADVLIGKFGKTKPRRATQLPEGISGD